MFCKLCKLRGSLYNLFYSIQYNYLTVICIHAHTYFIVVFNENIRNLFLYIIMISLGIFIVLC